MTRGKAAETCGDFGGTNRQGEGCKRPSGWGTPNTDGKCRNHLGTSPDGSSHEGKQFRVTHGKYADSNLYFKSTMSDDERTLCTDIFRDYATDYVARHGEIPFGIECELFEIAVSHIKTLNAENWSVERPEELDSGNPLVDREVHYTEQGKRYHRYKETVVLKAQQSMSRDRRSWLKNLGLLEDPESAAAGALGDAAGAYIESLKSKGLGAGGGGK